VAERIRGSVSAAEFAPDGNPYRLTVSVGGAFFSGHLSFSELFRIADQQLYLAKRNGRDRIALAPALVAVSRTAA
jgi:GGDEF domain-containing protein